MSSIIPFAYNRAGNALLTSARASRLTDATKKNAAKTGQGPHREVSRPGCARRGDKQAPMTKNLSPCRDLIKHAAWRGKS
jgi:hypothetical protein